MGEGEGKQDVSDQITDEEQLLGQKDDGDQGDKGGEKPDNKAEKDDKSGVEMSQGNT